MKNFLKVCLVGTIMTTVFSLNVWAASEVVGTTAAGAKIAKTIMEDGTEIWTSTTKSGTIFATGAQIAEVTGDAAKAGLWDSVVGGLGKFSDWVGDSVKGAGKWVLDGVKGGYNWVSDGAVSLTDSIKNAGSLGDAAKAGAGAVTNAAQTTNAGKTLTDGQVFSELYNTGDVTDPWVKGGLFDSVMDGNTRAISGNGAVYVRGDGSWTKVLPGDTVYKDGSFYKIASTDGASLILEDGTQLDLQGGVTPTFQSQGLNGSTVNYAQLGDGSVVGSDGSQLKYNADTKTWETTKPSEQLAAEQKGEAQSKTGEAKDKAKEAKSPIDTANVTNAIQYAILILQSVEGMNQEDATREVTVKGAEKLQESQGQTSSSTLTTDTTLDGSNISCAANSMVYLLQKNPVDLGLLDLSEFDLSVQREKNVARSNRDLFLQQYAVSAQVIAEGSNTISSQFYTRTSALTEAAPNTSGSLGAASVVNDSERYPYFEMVRQAALSAVQLGLKGASILPDIQVIDVDKADQDDDPEDAQQE